MLVTMKEILQEAQQGNYAVAAPNVASEFEARAVIEAAEELNAPLILDVDYGSVTDIFFCGQMLRQLAMQSNVPIAINLDHGKDEREVLAAINAGFTSVMIDRSACAFEENEREVSGIVSMAHEIGISVEAELGHVGQAMNYETDRDAALTDPEEAAEYVRQTGVDCLAVAIGTAHGSYPPGMVPYLDFERLEAIRRAVGDLPLVLHGSSGCDHESLRKACSMGINKVNISNDLCKAMVAAVKENDLEGQNAYNVMEVIKKGLKNKMKEMIRVYGSVNKARIRKGDGLPGKDTDRME